MKDRDPAVVWGTFLGLIVVAVFFLWGATHVSLYGPLF